MDKFIVFATIFFQGEVKQLEYKAIDFSSKKECYEYMTKHDKHFGEVVDGIRNSIQPSGQTSCYRVFRPQRRYSKPLW